MKAVYDFRLFFSVFYIYVPQNDYISNTSISIRPVPQLKLPNKFDVDIPNNWIPELPNEVVGCSNCARIAAVSQFSWLYSTQIKKAELFSTQMVVDCAGTGCTDVPVEEIYDYLRLTVPNLSLEVDYPYIGKVKQCEVKPPPESARKFKIKDALSLSKLPHNIVKNFLYHEGPIITEIDLTEPLEEEYINLPAPKIVPSEMCPEAPSTNHAVLLMGWGTIDSIEYWKIRNNRGLTWGFQGDGYLRVGNNIIGQCGIMQKSYVMRIEKV